MTTDEYRSMFALWCVVKSPLMLGSDLTLMTKESEAFKIITNKRLLEINQDSLGRTWVFDFLRLDCAKNSILWIEERKLPIYYFLKLLKILGIQGSCVKDCCSHGPMGGITSRWTCYHFAHSWQVNTNFVKGYKTTMKPRKKSFYLVSFSKQG